ncbi:MAG: hypothetical protein BGO14_02580 [Chlamydiales bacterium 38-26]|nr:hypothetical protein [Chlamydiales bacterium]OJV09238.1 MAG: hypothetical protein BGO14_02580 [Chlamydiales bacterium 38-26]
MAKTNYTKVEDSLKKGIDRLAIKKIVDSTDSKKSEKEKEEEFRLNRRKIAIYLISEIKRLHKGDERIYNKLGVNIANLKKLLEHPLKLSEEEWKSVLKLKDKIEAYKKAYAKTIKEISNEELIQKEREKQPNKRFNIQERWLPID